VSKTERKCRSGGESLYLEIKSTGKEGMAGSLVLPSNISASGKVSIE
jgi:hypothetical protein